MNSPLLERIGNAYRVSWEAELVVAEVRRLTDRDYGPGAEVTWLSMAPGQEGFLYQSFLGFLSSGSKNSLAKSLSSRQPGKNWDALIEQLTMLVLRDYRKGESAVDLRTQAENATPPALAIEPFVFDGHPFVLFGPPASGKSFLSLLLAALAATTEIEVPPFRSSQQMRVLMLDWESSSAVQSARLAQLERGLGCELDNLIAYRSCTAPLERDIESIQHLVMQRSIDLLVIDSLGPATGGDLNVAQNAQSFFSSLRTLGCTSLILAHTAKNPHQSQRSIFGSMFFGALARGTAQVRRFQEVGEDTVSIGIYHDKSNFSRLEPPIGLTMEFDNAAGSVSFSQRDIRDVSTKVRRVYTPKRILMLLDSVSDGLQPKEIASELDVQPSAARKALSRLHSSGEVIRNGDGSYRISAQSRLSQGKYAKRASVCDTSPSGGEVSRNTSERDGIATRCSTLFD